MTATLDTGTRLTAPYAIVATGVGPLQPRDVARITAPEGLALPPLWQAGADDAEGRTLLVLGGDRPIGTFLRAHPTTDTRLLVAYPAADAYKIEEIREDPRVTLLPVEHLTLNCGEDAQVSAEAVGQGAARRGLRHTGRRRCSEATRPTRPPCPRERGAAMFLRSASPSPAPGGSAATPRV